MFGEGSRGYDNPLGESSLARQRKEVPEVTHGNRGVIKLTLDGTVGFAFPELRYKVNTRIGKRVSLFLALWPVFPKPYIRKNGLILRITFQPRTDKAFKSITFILIKLLLPVIFQNLA